MSLTTTLARPPTDPGALPFLRSATLEGNRLTASVEPARINEAMAGLVPHQMSDLTVSPASLEDLFLRRYDADHDRDDDDGDDDIGASDSGSGSRGSSHPGADPAR